FAASINEACCSFDSLAIGQTLLSSNQCDDVALHAAPVAVERVLLIVHARRRTCLVMERAQTREPPVPFGGWLPHRVPALNDLDNRGLTSGDPRHHESSSTNSRRNLRVPVDRQLADLEGLPQKLAYILTVLFGFLTTNVCLPTEELVTHDEREHFRQELRAGVVLVLLDGVRVWFDQRSEEHTSEL